MKLRHKLAAAVAALAAVISMTGCNLFGGTTTTTSALSTYNFSEMKLIQLEEPKDGAMLAVISTTLGDIKVILYPEYCPNTVDNFVERAKEGFYDGKDIFAVEPGVYFLTGSDSEDGMTGITNDGQPITNEYSVNLWPFKGALLGYGTSQGSEDSRFFIVNQVELTDEDMTELESYKNEDGTQTLPVELLTAFKEKGVVAGLAGMYTVFGQTIEGFDVIEAITAVATSTETMHPTESIYINKVEITEYKSAE